MEYHVITQKLNTTAAETFMKDIQEDSAYYVFAAKHTTYTDGGDQNISTPVDSVAETTTNIYNDLIFGKRVRSVDVARMIPRYDWTSGTYYAMYDDQDSMLSTKEFYTCVNVGTQTHVYKCIYNNKGASSTVEPSGTEIYPFETPEDGYVWKYMYTANDSMMDKFATTTHIPVVANTQVVANAHPGSIEAIIIDNGGTGYNGYLIDEFVALEDIDIGGSGYFYGLGPNASSIDNYYNGSIIKITSGAAKDEYKFITNYYISGGQRIIQLDDPFDGAIQVTDTFEIYPFVYVWDTGGQKTTNCMARAIVSNTSGNTVDRVEILNSGGGYRSANATIGFIYESPILSGNANTPLVSNPAGRSAIYSNAVLRSVISPPGGHGSDPYTELGAAFVGVSIKFIGNEAPFTIDNDYRVVGLIKNPLYANVEVAIDVNNTTGVFSPNEKIYRYTSSLLVGNVDITLGNTTLIGNSTLFADSLSNNDIVLITDGDNNIVANVVSVASNSSLTLSVSPGFTNTGCTIEVIKNRELLGTLISNSYGIINISNVNPLYALSSTKLYGEESFATSLLSNTTAQPLLIRPQGRPANNFYTFSQLKLFTGDLLTGPFEEDEVVTQTSAITFAQPVARYHSGNSTYMYVTNANNIFQTETSPDSDGIITGSTSEAQFTVTNTYPGELVVDSGKVMYIENLSEITRTSTQTEAVKLIIQF